MGYITTSSKLAFCRWRDVDTANLDIFLPSWSGADIDASKVSFPVGGRSIRLTGGRYKVDLSVSLYSVSNSLALKSNWIDVLTGYNYGLGIRVLGNNSDANQRESINATSTIFDAREVDIEARLDGSIYGVDYVSVSVVEI